MDKNLMKYISKFGLFLVVFSFFMPMALATNGFELATELSYTITFISIFLYTSFLAALAGVFLIVGYILKKDVKLWMEWLPLIISILSAIIAFLSINEIRVNVFIVTNAGAGIVFLVIGYIIATVFLFIPTLLALKRLEKFFFSINKPYKYIICGLILLVLFSGVLAGLLYRTLIRTPNSYYSLLAFYNGIANTTVGFFALILGPIAGLIAGLLETILTLIFKIGFHQGNMFIGLRFILRIGESSVYYYFMYALYGLVTGLCFHFMKLKTNISVKKIVVINSIIVVFNVIINHLIFSAIYHKNIINLVINGVFAKWFGGLLPGRGYPIQTILTRLPVHIIVIECVTMVVIGTLFILYYRKAMRKKPSLDARNQSGNNYQCFGKPPAFCE